MVFSNWLTGLLRPRKNSAPKLATRRDSNKRTLYCESLETRRMLSGVTTVPQTVVYADPIGDVLIAGSPFEGQELAASNNLVDADGLIFA